jgi:hypothetical protein
LEVVVNDTSLDFLMIDLDKALSSAGLALKGEGSAEDRTRHAREAKATYLTTFYLSSRLSFTPAEASTLHEKLNSLRIELSRLGIHV